MGIKSFSSVVRSVLVLAVVSLGAVGACDDDNDTIVIPTGSGGTFGGTGGTGVGGSGGTDAGTDAVTQFVITISDFTFSPSNLTVPAGATVTVRNLEATPHSVTSQAAAGQFVPGSVAGISFDTGAFSLGERTFTIPANAPSGTVIPYFCKVHLGAMRNAGQITVQ